MKEITTGASNDLERATAIARQMVARYGMSESLGYMTFQQSDGGESFFGKGFSTGQSHSEETALLIDQEVGQILKTCYSRGKKLLMEYKDSLESLAKLLLEKEVVNVEDVTLILGSKNKQDLEAS
jgi:cell division protease FtsH